MTAILPPGETFLLFVYGTLMRGGVRHRILAGQHYLGVARTRPRYALFHLGDYPGLVPCAEGGSTTHGELYEVAGSLVPELDEAEGSPSWFRLGPVEVEGHAGSVYAYFYQPDTRGEALCKGGRWSNPTDAPGDGP
jgi:gamma-glutamylcyclotransferase (GGCT)/AIG2-like uncharacterized protein YtfP